MTAPVPNSKRALADALIARKGKRAEKFTAAEKASIFGRYLGGETKDDIGATMGVSGKTIANLIKKAIEEGYADEEK